MNGPRWGKLGAMRARAATLVASSVNPPGAVVWAAACPASAAAMAATIRSVEDRRPAIARIPSEVAEDGARDDRSCLAVHHFRALLW